MKRICLILIIINTATLIYSQSVWTGNAAVSGEKEFESYYSEDSITGKFLGASNSFPGSTEVTVTNPRNGKKVSVSIVKRLSQPGLFLVLSPEAGKAINLPDDDILNVEVVVSRKNEEIFSSYSDDKAYSDDPDLNPSAEIPSDKPGSGSALNTDVVELPSIPEKTAEPEIEPPVQTGVNEFIPPVVMNEEGFAYDEGYDPLIVMESENESEPLEPGEIVEIIDDPVSLARTITGSVAEPDIPLPETYDTKDLPGSYTVELPENSGLESSPEVIGITPESEAFSDTLKSTIILAEPDFPESELVESGILEPEAFSDEFMDTDIEDLLITESMEKAPVVKDPVITEVVISESEIEEDDLFFEEAPVIEKEQLIEEQPLISKAEEIDPANVIYFLTPGDFRPPPQSEEKIEKEKLKEKVKETVVVALPVERSKLEAMIVTELHNGGSYLQLGTYRSVEVLYNQIERINNLYPAIVLTTGSEENKLYKLLIGPISRDEKGIVMTRFRSQGYSDAFLYSPR
jgi:hypothetical protein